MEGIIIVVVVVVVVVVISCPPDLQLSPGPAGGADRMKEP